MLGCGPSWGVPRIGGEWGACDRRTRASRRRRCSVMVEEGGARLLVGTSPDLREQLLDAGVSALDAVLLTHAHADHLHGTDDLRTVNRLMGRAIPLFADAATMAQVEQRFGYIFAPINPHARASFYKPALERRLIDGPFEAAGIAVTPFAQGHGFSTTLGFRFGRFAYSTDVIELDSAAFAALAGVDLWIVDSIRPAPHETHSRPEKTLSQSARAQP